MCLFIETYCGICTNSLDSLDIVCSTCNMKSSASSDTFLVYLDVVMVEKLGVDARVVVADGDCEGGVAVADKIDIGTVIEEVIEDW